MIVLVSRIICVGGTCCRRVTPTSTGKDHMDEFVDVFRNALSMIDQDCIGLLLNGCLLRASSRCDCRYDFGRKIQTRMDDLPIQQHNSRWTYPPPCCRVGKGFGDGIMRVEMDCRRVILNCTSICIFDIRDVDSGMDSRGGWIFVPLSVAIAIIRYQSNKEEDDREKDKNNYFAATLGFAMRHGYQGNDFRAISSFSRQTNPSKIPLEQRKRIHFWFNMKRFFAGRGVLAMAESHIGCEELWKRIFWPSNLIPAQ